MSNKQPTPKPLLSAPPLFCCVPLALSIAAALLFGTVAQAVEGGWWPEQVAPTEVISIAQPSDPAERVLVEGLAGLWARAVNEGRGHSLLWIDRSVYYPDWKNETVERLAATQRTISFQGLLRESSRNGYLDGFVVYQLGPSGASSGGALDHSINIATMLAGVLDAAIVDVSLVDQMLARGLTQLADARTMTYEQVWTQYADQLDHSRLFDLSPANDGRVERMRAVAVAHRGRLAFGINSTTVQAMQATSIPAPIYGWGAEDEFSHISQGTRMGLFSTVSNWLANVTVLSAGARESAVTPISSLDPVSIDWDDKRPPVSFVVSDGDNTGWVARGFWGNPNGSPGQFWDHPEHGDFPMGFTVATSDLADFAPVVIDRLAQTKPEETSVIHFSGYYYPDLFAVDRPGRETALRELARTKARQMKKTGATIMTFIAQDTSSPNARQAMQIFAEEIQPLLGMLIMDFAPYNAKQGQTFWFDDGRGGQVPAVTARYALWDGLTNPNSGSPEDVAAFINQDHGQFTASWGVLHAWSEFPRPDGSGTDQGVPAIRRAVDAVDSTQTNIASPEEMLWRLRVAQDREAAERLNEEIHHLPPGSSPRLGGFEPLSTSSFDPGNGIDYAAQNRPSGWFGDHSSDHPVRVWSFGADRAPAADAGYFGEIVRADGTAPAWWMSSRFSTGGSSTYTVTFDFKSGTDPAVNSGRTRGNIDFVYRNWNGGGGYLGPDLNLSLHNASGSIGEPEFIGANDFLTVSVEEPDALGWRTITVTGETTSPDAATYDLWFIGRDSFTGSYGIDNVAVQDGIEAPTNLLSAWRLLHFGTSESTGDAADSADPDGDGTTNLLEYALGTDPTVATGDSAVTSGIPAEGALTLTFPHIGDPELIYAIESTEALDGEWQTLHTYPAFTENGTETFTDTTPVATTIRRFLRVRIAISD